MAKNKYQVLKTTTGGRTTYYAQPVWAGTLSQDEIIHEACANTSYEESLARGIMEEVMKAVQRNVAKGFRCELGQQFLTIYPNLSVSVSAEDPTKVSPDMVTARNAKSRLGCTVSPKYSQQFASEVSWQKVDKSGVPVTDDDDITLDPTDPTNPTTPGSGQGNVMD